MGYQLISTKRPTIYARKYSLSPRHFLVCGILLAPLLSFSSAEPPKPSPPSGRYFVSWLGNSFSGAGNKWVQNHFIHMKAFGDYGGIASGKPGEVKRDFIFLKNSAAGQSQCCPRHQQDAQ